jgi:predicted DCC family thiol-disulfide oxidoreductase YuxK
VKTLHVLYDAKCGFCQECRTWMAGQPSYVELRFWPAQAAATLRRFPTLAKSDPDELLVVSDEGRVWRGVRAWLMCLWALRAYRAWSLALAKPALMPLARAAFELVSNNRGHLSKWLWLAQPRRWLAELQRASERSAGCEDDACGPRGRLRPRPAPGARA